MKKILSLLSMLMITVTAFATDFIGQLDYKVTTKTGFFNGPSYANGTLKIEDYAGGKYTVTATGCDLSSLEMGNWGEIICEGVEATTDANGVTTIDVTPYALRGSDNAELTNAKLFVKFKGDKAYATFKGTYNPNFFTNITVEYTFGVDEGFEGGGSTGGGETGGEEKPAAFEKVNFVGDGTNFNWSIPVDWDTQKIVMSIDPSTCTGACEDIIGLGEVATAWDNTLHLYRKPDGTLQGYFNVPGGSNNNTNPFDETNPIKVEVSKAKGFVVNDVVKIPASEMSALFALSTVNMGTGEGANDKSRATYNYVKVVDKDWTEPTEPETPEAVAYKNELTIVRGANHKVYNDAEVTVLAKGEGKYEVTLPEFADMDLTNSGTVGKIVFTANGEEVDGVLKLTAENAAGVISTGEGWTKYAADVTMSGEVENNQLAAKFTVVLGAMSDYTYTLGYGKEIFIPTTETVTDWANIKFGDSDPVNIENAKLDITMVSMSTAMVTFKDVMINGNNIGDFAISGVKASINTDDYTTTVLTTEATKGTWVRATENNALGVIVGAESDIRNFEGTQDENAGKTVVKFGVFFGSAYGWADIVFGEKVDTPDQPKDDYAVNFDKDANSTHSSRALNSFSLQQTGKEKQTKSVKTSKAAYEDHTADEPFTVEAGSELTASFDYTGEWMHSFVYIDFDNDGKFSYKEGQWDQAGTDLVAFSFYSLDSNPKNDASGYNSVGDELTGDARNTYAAPSFKAPAKAGEYRIRFKFDWNCILPGGSSSILSDGGGVWDATLKVVEPVVDGISTINAEVANGEAQLFTVDGVQIAKLQKGLNIVRTADGKVKKVLVK